MVCFRLVLVFATFVSLSSARAVNISNTWMLPEEGFPVFYRYFRDRISWYEADAVCQFHHANLVTGRSTVTNLVCVDQFISEALDKGRQVDVIYTDLSKAFDRLDHADATSQYDAIRAYLKELDITDKVWIGLSKTSERPNFTWTDFRPLNGEGHWQEAIPKASDPICVAVDSAADFLWKSLHCGGPEVASFICELPIPSWALGPRGCLLTELPSLTVLYIPEQSAIELTSDCGLDGTKRIACKGNADREEILKQLTCAISHEDFDEKSTKPPLASSTGYETSSDENSLNGKTTKTWIWTSNTVDIDYGMPTRHRRETEDTLSPISTKSTTGLSTIKQKQKKVTPTESFTTPATNYDTDVTTNSLEGDSTLDSSVAKIPDNRTGVNQTHLTTQDVNTRSEEQAEMISVTVSSSAETKFTEHDVDDTGAEYSSVINQGQLFSIIENGTMFDIIELNDTTAETDLKTPQEIPATQETKSKKPKTEPTESFFSTVTPTKEYIDNKLHAKDIKSRKKDVYKFSDSKKAYKSSSTPKPTDEKQNTNIINKEVELYPIVKDPSLKLNRTFRKELPPIPEEYSEIDTENKLETSKLIDLSINNDLSNPISEHIEIKLQGKSKDNITETLFITTSRRHNEFSKGYIEPNKTRFITEEIEISEVPNNESPKTIAEIDPRIDILNSNVTKNNESEMVNNSLSEKIKEVPQTTLSIMKKQFLPKSLVDEIQSAVTTTKAELTGVSENPLETEPEEQPRPNRQRQLTRPQRRSFYPYFFSRVLG